MKRLYVAAFVTLVASFLCVAAKGQCEGSWYTDVGQPGIDGPAFASSVFTKGNKQVLYVGGDFLNAGAGPAKFVASWEGATWASTGYPANGNPVFALSVFDHGKNERYLTALEQDAFQLSQIRFRDNAQWLDQNTIGGQEIHAICSYDDDGPGNHTGVIAYCSIYYMPYDPFQHYLVFSDPFGGGYNFIESISSVFSYAVIPHGEVPLLLAGTEGGVTVYDRKLGYREFAGGLVGSVYAMAVFDDGSGPALFAAGDFTEAHGAPMHSIAKWDGEIWSDVGGGVQGGFLSGVYTLTVFDDGNGPSLYAGGSFDSAGGAPAANIARWNGATWQALGEGVTGDDAAVFTMTPFVHADGKEFLYVGGSFEFADGSPANNIARWGCGQAKPCYADCDGTNTLDLFDFLCFVNQFNAGVPYSDCTQDGVYDLFDFLCFVNAFNAGCP